MAKFPLFMSENKEEPVKNIAELREKFDNDRVIDYYLSGKLQEWLEEWHYEKEFEILKDIEDSENGVEKMRKICNALGVEYDENAKPDVDKRKKFNEKRKCVKSVTGKEELLEKAHLFAFNQEQLDELLKDGNDKIYLCKSDDGKSVMKCFSVPASISSDTLFLEGVENSEGSGDFPCVVINVNYNFRKNKLYLKNVKISNSDVIVRKMVAICLNYSKEETTELIKCIDEKIQEELKNSIKLIYRLKYWTLNDDFDQMYDLLKKFCMIKNRNDEDVLEIIKNIPDKEKVGDICYKLGLFLEKEKKDTEDFEKKIFELGCEYSNPWSAFRLGNKYNNKYRSEKDMGKAFYYFSKGLEFLGIDKTIRPKGDYSFNARWLDDNLKREIKYIKKNPEIYLCKDSMNENVQYRLAVLFYQNKDYNDILKFECLKPSKLKETKYLYPDFLRLAAEVSEKKNEKHLFITYDQYAEVFERKTETGR